MKLMKPSLFMEQQHLNSAAFIHAETTVSVLECNLTFITNFNGNVSSMGARYKSMPNVFR